LGTISDTKTKKRKCNYLEINKLQILFSLKSGVGGIQTLSTHVYLHPAIIK